MAKKTYFVTEPLRHDGDDVAVGGKVVLEPEAAAALLQSGVISEAKPGVETEQKAGE